MNREVAIISTLERLNERISKLERSSGVKGKLGTFIGVTTEEVAQQIVSHALNWFNGIEVEPDDLFYLSMEGLSLDVPSEDQIKELATFIRSHGDMAKKMQLLREVKNKLKTYRNSSYFGGELSHGIRKAFTLAYDIVPRNPMQ
jgi:hypothetical protein